MKYAAAPAVQSGLLAAAFGQLLGALTDAAALADESGEIVAANGRLAELTGAQGGCEALIGRRLIDAVTTVDPEDFEAKLRSCVVSGESLLTQAVLVTPEGGALAVEVVLDACAGDNTSGAVLIRLRPRGADPAQQEVAERRYRQLALSAGDLVTLHAPDRTLLAAYGRGAFPGDQDPTDFVGGQLELVAHADDVSSVASAWAAAARSTEPVTLAYRVQRVPGEWAWVESSIQAVRDREGALVELQTVNRDITEQRASQHELARLALRDPLTGLANRLLFGDRLRAAVARLGRRQSPIAVLLLDIDRFKGVNDSLGHPVGDRLLTELGARLTACVRASDTVARLSGDEFAVLAEDLDNEAAAQLLAERALTALQIPYELEGGFTITVTPSIGVTLSTDSAITPDELMREADVALYAAKSAGRNRLALFDAPLRHQVSRRISVDQQARRALANGDLFCEYQPIIDLTDGTVVLAEALVRLRDSDGGLLLPRAFLPVCEDTGLVLELDRQVIARVLREISRLRAGERGRCPIVSINVSSRTLTDPRFPATVADLLTECGLEGGGLAFELTEPTLPVGGSGVDATVAGLAEMGIGIGLDNFGTGSTALSTLTTLEIDYVKLDATFLAAAASSAAGMSVNKAVVDLAKALGLAVVGQGIEHPAHAAVLAALGGMMAQGHLLATPMPLSDVPARVRLAV